MPGACFCRAGAVFPLLLEVLCYTDNGLIGAAEVFGTSDEGPVKFVVPQGKEFRNDSVNGRHR